MRRKYGLLSLENTDNGVSIVFCLCTHSTSHHHHTSLTLPTPPFFHSLLGQRNLVYLLFMLALWYVTGMYEIFFAFTSYVHYFRFV